MIKKQIAGVFTLLLCLLLTACQSSGGSTASIDLNTLKDNILENVTFDTEMVELEEEAARQQYGVDDSVSVTALTGSSAKVDEVALFEAKDETAAGEIVSLLKNHIEKQKNDYASYAPNEVPKLDNAVLLQNGKYVALCITSDYKTAESTIQASFK